MITPFPTMEEIMALEENRMPAAILACEAARQKTAITDATTGGPKGKDIPGELLTYYRYFLKELAKLESQ
jgi:hypothetical protein